MSETAGTPGPGAGAQPPAAAPWYSSLPEDVRGFAELKGWKDPGAAVQSYRDLEKLRGVPAERLLQLPEKPDDKEAWGKVYERLGRPAKAEEYELPKFEGAGYDLGKDFRSWAHESGLSKTQAKAMGEKYDGLIQTLAKQQQDSYHQDALLAEQNLRREWGQAYDANLDAVERAGRHLGWEQDQLLALRKAVGSEKAQKLFAWIGNSLKEDAGPGADPFARGANGRNFTPEAHRAKFDQLKTDHAFMARYMSGDKAAEAEFRRASDLAFGDGAPGGPPPSMMPR